MSHEEGILVTLCISRSPLVLYLFQPEILILRPHPTQQYQRRLHAAIAVETQVDSLAECLFPVSSAKSSVPYYSEISWLLYGSDTAPHARVSGTVKVL